jgi:CheY-like chemotaxis protein
MIKHILLIEDDLDIQRVYSEKLKIEGYEVSLAIDVPHGLQLVETIKPDLILLDIMLPGKMNGFEMLQYLKGDERYRKIPVIVMTNLDTEREEALKIGAVDYLIKAETELSVLIEKIKHIN